MRRKLLILCITAAFTGCTVGPNYKRPDVPAPPQFRAGEANLRKLRWVTRSGSTCSRTRHFARPH